MHFKKLVKICFGTFMGILLTNHSASATSEEIVDNISEICSVENVIRTHITVQNSVNVIECAINVMTNCLYAILEFDFVPWSNKMDSERF